MKKTYQKPETVENMILVKNVFLSNSNPSATIDSSSEVEAADIESRRHFSVWGDDE